MDTPATSLPPEASDFLERFTQASHDDAAALLRWHLREAQTDPQCAQNLALALRALEDDRELAKPLRKLVRKGLFLLGAHTDPDAPADDTAMVEATADWQAWLTSTDGTGVCHVLLARPDGKMNHRLLSAYLKEGEGVDRAQEERLSTHDLAAFIEELRARYGNDLMFADVDPAYVKHRLAAAVAEARKQGSRVPSTLAYWASSLPPAEEPVGHPVEVLQIPDKPAGEEIGKALFLDAAIGWMYELPQVAPIVKEIADVANSKIEVEEHVQRERYRGILRKAATELFTEVVAARYELRLRDLAYLQAKAGNDNDAALAVAAARDVAAAGAESQFAFALAEKSLVYCLEMARRAR
jgi:hypothetical protein